MGCESKIKERGNKTYEGGEIRKVLEMIYPGSLLSIVKCMLHLIKV